VILVWAAEAVVLVLVVLGILAEAPPSFWCARGRHCARR
jgi:hypothetical protein